MSAPTRRENIIADTEQYILNRSFDEDFDVILVRPVTWTPAGSSAASLSVQESPNLTTAMAYDANNNMIYSGKAAVGSAKSSAYWQIKKYTWTAGNLTDIQFADGNTNFDNVWDNREALTYA